MIEITMVEYASIIGLKDKEQGRFVLEIKDVEAILSKIKLVQPEEFKKIIKSLGVNDDHE